MVKAPSASEPIRVLIVDEHAMLRRGLAAVLRVMPGIELVGEAANGMEAIKRCGETLPDVVLMDLKMPVMGGVEATRIIRQRWAQVQVLALSSFQERAMIDEVLEAGAIGYLLKNISAAELGQAIRAAHAGCKTLSPEVRRAMRDGEPASPQPGQA